MSQPIKLMDEDLGVLIQIFSYLEVSPEKNGTARVSGERIPSEIAVPFFRALMRREARLLREDADAMRNCLVEPRTHDQRRADAFVDLLENISAARRYFPGDLDGHG